MPRHLNRMTRELPAVDAILGLPEAAGLAAAHGRNSLVAAVRADLAALRADLLAGGSPGAGECAAGAVLGRVGRALERAARPRLDRVVNATGIILHTGLGRAPMPEAARVALARAAGYCNLQHDLDTGRRGRREACVRGLVRELTGAQDALVVNNNAGATFLLLAALAAGREVVVSRGELIEIGGSFRLPDIMQASGVVLREVGTTNKTHLKDYQGAMGPQTALLFKAHKSNYQIVGFSQEVGIAEIARIGRRRRRPVVDDLGCGALVGLERYGLAHEVTVRESLAAGADLALFSTDKLIGGPQGGMIVGRAKLIEQIRAHPLYRVLRVCKLTLAALEATLRLFQDPDRLAATHPLYALVSKTPAAIKAQAEDLKNALAGQRPDWEIDLAEEVSYLGGGSLPGEGLPSWAVRIRAPGARADALALRLRQAPVPVVARVAGGRVVLDLRAVFPADHADILKAAEGVQGSGFGVQE